jgi:hypothetical protein
MSGTRRIRPDPPLRPDGRCAVCHKPRRPERSRRYGGAVAELDPFCSVTCARQYHGTMLPATR